tara:strand:- start:1572 stop:1763 length:192 start_codon:yes stop_codon:yes gene_type:complete
MTVPQESACRDRGEGDDFILLVALEAGWAKELRARIDAVPAGPVLNAGWAAAHVLLREKKSTR